MCKWAVDLILGKDERVSYKRMGLNSAFSPDICMFQDRFVGRSILAIAGVLPDPQAAEMQKF